MPVLTIITLPVDFVTDITGNASDLLTDLSPVVTLIVGVLLATIVITIIVQAIKH